ncbi:hypothetical protein [Acidiphilium iwatense]|uniref:Uncharacterized protein n=1 Tax=Acidiphilium iwatense TaxID=768198 RepID=A0ABS9DYC7_9PROT|nr:hypothetical protein [Acidiphilium iwatense]MCF3947752.1 hypothetical protein [Acidiphilium iwatense]
MADVQDLWKAAGWRDGGLDTAVCTELADLLNTQRGDAPDPDVERLQAAARAAHTVLLAWCAGAWYEDGTQLARNGTIHELETALTKAAPLLCSPSLSQQKKPDWFIAAIRIWAVAAGLLERHGRTGGKTANSVAVRFTSAALRCIGFPLVTDNAVSITIKKAVRKV